MAIWQTPIFDRTEADIEYAKQKLNEWRITPPETYVDLKGCFNVSDINRIEQNTRYLRDLLTEMGYYIPTQYSKYDWTINDLPLVSDIQRIIINVEIIKENFITPVGWETLPRTLNNYEQVNTIEKDLQLLLNTINVVRSQYSDRFYSGDRNILPLGDN